jgi:heptosyltransferase-2
VADSKTLLLIKCGAAGDVLRTTALLHVFKAWNIDWFTASENTDLLLNEYIDNVLDDPGQINSEKVYDLIINLEDDLSLIESLFPRLRFVKFFGSYIDKRRRIQYTSNSAEWFDLGLISKYGIKKANDLKLKNRSSYQEIVFRCLGFTFNGERYVLPKYIPSSELKGDIAIAPKAGQRWPMKTWYYFEDLKTELSKNYRVNLLPMRRTMLEHIADIKQHRFVISPDSLPMHIALGLGIPCAAFFTCTSPWEIYDYSLLTKIVSPKLKQYFYRREYVEDAVKCIPYREVYDLIVTKLRLYNIQTHTELR